VLTFPFPILEFKHVTWLEWLWTGFGLVIRFIEHTDRNYCAIANLHCGSVQHVLSLLSLLYLNQWMFPGSRPCRLTAISHQPLILLPSRDFSVMAASPRYIALAQTTFNSYSIVALHSRYLAMAASLALQFLLWTTMPDCSLLKALHPELPTGMPPFLLFQGLCFWGLWLAPPSLWTGFYGDYSCCSHLKAHRPKRFPDKVPGSWGVPSSSFSKGCVLDV
jgi:hypothetical protein